MHNFIVNASIQILPLSQDRHAYEWVDEAISIIQQSGLIYEIGPFTTVVDGNYADVIKLIGAIHDHLFSLACPEWIAQVQIQIRSNGNMVGLEKTAKYL